MESQNKNNLEDSKSYSDNEKIIQSESQSDRETHGAGLVLESRNWYRDRFRQMATIAVIVTVLLACSLIVNGVQAVMQPHPVYFAATDDLRIKKLHPLDKPILSQSGLFNWTTRKITETFSLDFVHWRESLMRVKPDYTRKAFGHLLDSLQNSGNLEMIKEKKLVLSATVIRSPVVRAKGVVNGRMTWKLEFPIIFSYESSERVVASQDLVCNVMVRRVSTLEHPRGIRIAQIILK